MKITDETLSAFLDGELPEPEMETLRQRLAGDEELGNRLAELAAVDPMLASRYAHIDERPLPDSVRELLAEEKPANVISFPVWRRMQQGFQQHVQQHLQQHAGIAAATTLAIGLGLGQLFAGGGADTSDDWATIARGLESTPSGHSVELTNGKQLAPRLSFLNVQGQYCRQYQLADGEKGSENIACRDAEGQSTAGSWQLAASVQLDAIQRPGDYQTASGGAVLDNALDQMMAGDALDANAEEDLIVKGWNQ